MYKHTPLKWLNTNISMSPLVQACLQNGKIRVKWRNEEVLSDSLADFVFLHITPFWKENQYGDWWVSLAEELCCWEVRMAVVQAEAYSWPHPPRDHSILVVIFHFWEIPFVFISLPSFLQGKWWVLHMPAQSLCLYSPPFMYVYASTFVNPFMLELVFGSCTSPSQAALTFF